MKSFRFPLAFTAVFVALAAPAVAGPLPAWDEQLSANQRFKVLADWNDQAVLDNETGLVWERTPGPIEGQQTALYQCPRRVIDGRMGWRVPKIDELSTLVAIAPRSVAHDGQLPAGHPFLGVSGRYWSITPSLIANEAYVVDFSDGSQPVQSIPTGGIQSPGAGAWCVRGPGSVLNP